MPPKTTSGVVGDRDEPTVLPVTDVPVQELEEEKKLAKYSRTAEFRRLKEFMEARVKFYQRFLPSGEMVELDPKGNLQVAPPRQDLTAHWMAACIVIKEFENILAEYERAAEATDGR